MDDQITMPIEKNDHPVKLWLTDSLYQALQDLALADDRSLSEYIRHVLTDHSLGALHRISRQQQNGRRNQGR